MTRPDPREGVRELNEQDLPQQTLVPDDLLDGPSDEHDAGSGGGSHHAAGTPGGGTPVGGLAGTTIGDGAPGNADLEDALFEDESRDEPDGGPPYAGHAGGAVGGTPAEGRATGGDIRGGLSTPGTHRGDSTIGSNPPRKPR